VADRRRDFCDGTPFSTEYLGEADIAAMNAIGYDFATLGNHEFNLPLSQTKKLIDLAAYRFSPRTSRSGRRAGP